MIQIVICVSNVWSIDPTCDLGRDLSVQRVIYLSIYLSIFLGLTASANLWCLWARSTRRADRLSHTNVYRVFFCCWAIRRLEVSQHACFVPYRAYCWCHSFPACFLQLVFTALCFFLYAIVRRRDGCRVDWSVRNSRETQAWHRDNKASIFGSSTFFLVLGVQCYH